MGVSIGTVIALIKALAGSGGGSGSGVSDVQVNGTSVVDDGVANVPLATSSSVGVVKPKMSGSLTYGLTINSAGELAVDPANDNALKAGTGNFKPICSDKAKEAAFYGLAKAAGDTSHASSNNAVGTYTESAKSAISGMLNAPETVSGSTPSITAKAGVRYICGECSTLTSVVPASGIIDVTFDSGTTPTVLTITPPTGVTIRWANGFDPSTDIEANTTYEINIMDGEFGVVGSWS